MPESAGDATALLDAAEALFARGGINGASLRAITAAAGVRNKSAVQYHFGDREGLVRAVLARRGEVLTARRAEVIEHARTRGREPSIRELVHLLVDPYFEFFRDGDGGLAYLVIANEVLVDPGRSYDDLQEQFNDPLLPGLIERMLEATDAPRQIAPERVLIAVSSVIASAAARARLLLDRTSGRAVVPDQLFAANLTDMVVAALEAPVDPSTLELCGTWAGPAARP